MNYIVSPSVLQDKLGEAARGDEVFLALHRCFAHSYARLKSVPKNI